MKPMRARFAKDIVAEFLPPTKPSNKVLILCSGLPSVPVKDSHLEYWSKKGYFVIFPRYRGTWESGGTFLDHSPHEDILDIIEELPKGVKDVWNGESYSIKDPEIYILGASFGGTAAILCSQDDRVKKVVAVAPVVDWTDDSGEEPMDWMKDMLKEAFGEAHRFDENDWDRLAQGGFYQPKAVIDQLDKDKIFIIMAEDDTIVRPWTIHSFVDELGCRAKFYQTLGHGSLSWAKGWKLSRQIRSFFHS